MSATRSIGICLAAAMVAGPAAREMRMLEYRAVAKADKARGRA